MSDIDRLADIVLDAMVNSDGGNNAFYRDDDEAVDLARQIAEAIVASGWPGSDPS